VRWGNDRNACIPEAPEEFSGKREVTLTGFETESGGFSVTDIKYVSLL
jgi:hypothetical protein